MHVGARWRRASAPWWWPVPSVVAVTIAVLSLSGAQGGFSAAVANPGDLAQTGSLLTAAATGGTAECDLATPANNPIQAANTIPCTGSLLMSGTLPGSATASAATIITDKGSRAATTAGVTAGACGPAQLANRANTADPMLVRGSTLSYAQPGPLTGGTGLGLSGTSAYAADVTSAPGPTTTSFTELVWFKAAAAGTLLGFTDTPISANANSWDKMLWVDNAGRVVFAVYPGATVELATASTYLDGKWHLAAGVLNTSTGMSLYVDAAAALTNTTRSAQSYNGYWHIGWDNENTGWTDPPSNPYFGGTLADAAIFPTALTSVQISTLFRAPSQAAWNTDISSDGAAAAWTLGDDGTTAYTGTVPGVTPNPCSFADVTVAAATASNTCAAPPSGSACPAPSSAVTLASLANKTTPFAVDPTPTQVLTVTTAAARDTTNTTGRYPDASGLHLTAPMSIIVTAGTFTATLTWPSENIIL
jgi:hypothetical protein